MVRGGQQPAADFDARGLRLREVDQACGNVAIDLGKLILVDRRLVPSFCGWLPRPNGQSTAKIAAAVISANTNHKVIKRVPVERRRPAGAMAPLYTTRRQAGQLTIVDFPPRQENPEKLEKIGRQLM